MNLQRFASLLLILTLLLNTTVTIAQDDSSPLLDALALVPNPAHGDLYFADFTAVEQAYPAAQRPADWADYEAASGAAYDIWRRTFRNTMLPGLEYFTLGDEIPAAMGIDFFEIDRALVDLAPPQTVMYLFGDFDPAAIGAALTARDFTQESVTGEVELWCGSVGCENSEQINVRERNPADFFGGDLGRLWGRLIAPQFMIGANMFEDLQVVEQVVNGQQDSLASNPLYQTAVAALSDEGTLLQAFIPSDVGLAALSDLGAMLPPTLSPEQRSAIIERLLDNDFEALPPYKLALFAQVVSETEEIGSVVLLFAQPDAAETAARIIPARIAAYQSLVTQRSFSDMLTERQVEVRAEVLPGEFYTTVRLDFAAPIPPAAVLADETARPFMYSLLLRAFAQRDLGWLSTFTRADLEALAGN